MLFILLQRPAFKVSDIFMFTFPYPHFNTNLLTTLPPIHLANPFIVQWYETVCAQTQASWPYHTTMQPPSPTKNLILHSMRATLRPEENCVVSVGSVSPGWTFVLKWNSSDTLFTWMYATNLHALLCATKQPAECQPSQISTPSFKRFRFRGICIKPVEVNYACHPFVENSKTKLVMQEWRGCCEREAGLTKWAIGLSECRLAFSIWNCEL